MPRFFCKRRKTEVLQGVHDLDEHVVVLPDDHAFFQPLPPGMVIDYDEAGLPVVVEAKGPTQEQKAYAERQWRDAELSKVVCWLDQIRNDEDFGSSSYSGEHTGPALNAYRVALCEYPAAADFPNGKRPSI